MRTNAGVQALGAVMLGVCLGVCQGAVWAWLPAQVCLTLMAALLQHCDQQARRPALLAGLFGMAYGLAGLSFIPLSLPGHRGWLLMVPMVVMIGAHAGLVAASAALLRYLPVQTPWRWSLAWPACWTLLEYAQSQGDYAVAWLTLGQMQAPYGPLAGLLPIGGVLLASLAMWCWAAVCAQLLLRVCVPRATSSRSWPGNSSAWIGVLVLPAVGLVVGQLSWTREERSFEAVLVQARTDLPAEATPAQAAQAAWRWRERLLELSRQHPSALILTPQGSLHLGGDVPSKTFLDALDAQLQARDADLLLGAYVRTPSGAWSNSAVTLGVSGRQRYDKTQLLPFGEFTPAWLQGSVRAAWPVPDRDLRRGDAGQSELLLGGHRAAMSICFELAFPASWHDSAAQADVLINLASDATHPSARLVSQALQLGRARALEFRKPLLRTSDWAGSFAVDASGRLLAYVPASGDGSVQVTVPARAGLTPYARFGNALVVGLAGISLLFALLLGRGASARRAAAAPASAATSGLRRQAGQVLMAALGLLVITAGLMYFMVNAGQMVTEKMRVTNAADAAAYSAGVVEARALNYDAYLNRAIVANEISIAQMVSVGSWVKYFASAIDGIPASFGDINFFLEPDARAAALSLTFAGAKYGLSYAGMTGDELADYLLRYGIGPIVTVHDLVVQAMSASQELVHLNLIAGARQWQVARDVAAEMDPKLQAQLVLTSHGFDGFTRQYAKSGGSGDERGRLADVTTRSRDEFTRERNWTIDSPFDIPLVRSDGALKKRGGTDLINYDEWRGVDTLELHGQRFGCGKLGLSWCGDVQTPVGWGAVNVNAGGGDAGRGHHGNAYGENGNTASLADSAMREPDFYSFSGLPGVRELDELDPDAKISTGVTILVSKQHGDTLTSGGAATARAGGRLAQFDGKPSGGKLVALSRAQVYFDRISARADGKTEIGSLYNPYWRVRLVAPTAGDKAYAAAQQGGMALPPQP